MLGDARAYREDRWDIPFSGASSALRNYGALPAFLSCAVARVFASGRTMPSQGLRHSFSSNNPRIASAVTVVNPLILRLRRPRGPSLTRELHTFTAVTGSTSDFEINQEIPDVV